jgi:hypothetical protein
MPENERPQSILDRLENASTPIEAVSELGRLSVRRLAAVPLNIGRDLLKIVMSGDTGEMIRAGTRHL